jgi:hypothetical protein
VSVGLLPRVAAGAGLGSYLSLGRFQLLLGMSWFPEVDVNGRPFAFGLTVGEVGSCLAFLNTRSTIGSVCVEAQAGAIHAVVRDLQPLRAGAEPWLAAGAGPRFSFAVHGPLRIDLGGLLVVPFSRRKFGVTGERDPVFQSSPVGGMAYLGVGAGLP